MRHIDKLTVGCLLLVTAQIAAQEPNSKEPDPKPTVRAEYPLNSKSGPWMVMVKSFQGPQAVDYANRLARELREKHKIVAYTYVKQPDQSVVQQAGYVRGRERQYVSAAVLAGDCKNEKTAAKLQDEIQKIRPGTITQDMVASWQWEAGTLRTAFCLPNPLNPVEESKSDTLLLLKLNSGRNSIYNCTGEYGLQVIVFSGGIAYTKKGAEQLKQSKMLEAAGERAELVCDELRKAGFDAYTFHGINFSLVSVGSFSSNQDPQIDAIRSKLAGVRIRSFDLSPSPQLVKVPKR